MLSCVGEALKDKAPAGRRLVDAAQIACTIVSSKTH